MEPRRISRPSRLSKSQSDSAPGTSAEDREQPDEVDVVEYVERRIEEQGFFLPTKPYYGCPSIANIMLDDQDDQKLMDLFRMYTAWSSYASTNLAIGVIAERQALARLKKHEAFALIEAWGDGTNAAGTGRNATKKVTVERARKYTSIDVQELNQEVLNTYAYRKMMETLHGNIQGELFAVSRELTRRGQLAPNERRAQQKFGV